MPSDPNVDSGMPEAGGLPGLCALVIYIPDPLGRFFDDLRRELAPHYNPHAHVSVLPPRPLAADWHVVSEQTQIAAASRPSFEIAAGAVRIFDTTDVIYLEIAAGAHDLRALHDLLNTNGMRFDEPFPYDPHITLAQGLEPHAVTLARERASRRWNAYTGPRSFRAEAAVLVRHSHGDHWLDLASYSFRQTRA